jgi:hypothetical protein
MCLKRRKEEGLAKQLKKGILAQSMPPTRIVLSALIYREGGVPFSARAVPQPFLVPLLKPVDKAYPVPMLVLETQTSQ